MHATRTRTFRSVVAVLAAWGLAFGVGGCGSGSDGPADGVAGNDGVSTDGGTERDVGQGPGSSSEGDPVLPEGWPSEVLPIPDGFTVEEVMNSERPAGERRNWRPTVVISGPKAQEITVLEEYGRRIEAAGYQITDTTRESVTGEKRNGDGDVVETAAASASYAGETTTVISLEWAVSSSTR